MDDAIKKKVVVACFLSIGLHPSRNRTRIPVRTVHSGASDQPEKTIVVDLLRQRLLNIAQSLDRFRASRLQDYIPAQMIGTTPLLSMAPITGIKQASDSARHGPTYPLLCATEESPSSPKGSLIQWMG